MPKEKPNTTSSSYVRVMSLNPTEYALLYMNCNPYTSEKECTEHIPNIPTAEEQYVWYMKNSTQKY